MQYLLGRRESVCFRHQRNLSARELPLGDRFAGIRVATAFLNCEPGGPKLSSAQDLPESVNFQKILPRSLHSSGHKVIVHLRFEPMNVAVVPSGPLLPCKGPMTITVTGIRYLGVQWTNLSFLAQNAINFPQSTTAGWKALQAKQQG